MKKGIKESESKNSSDDSEDNKTEGNTEKNNYSIGSKKKGEIFISKEQENFLGKKRDSYIEDEIGRETSSIRSRSVNSIKDINNINKKSSRENTENIDNRENSNSRDSDIFRIRKKYRHKKYYNFDIAHKNIRNRKFFRESKSNLFLIISNIK